MIERFRENNGMKMLKPAARWQEALPSGNGPVGALVFGAIAHEVIVLSHEDLWYGGHDISVPDVSGHLPELRRLLAVGDFDAANMFLTDKLHDAGYHYRLGCFHPACDLRIDGPLHNPFTGYERTLDFATGEVCATWKDGTTRYTRRLFVSRVDDVVVCLIEKDGPDPISCRIRFAPRHHELIENGDEDSRPLPFAFEAGATEGMLHIVGHKDGGGVFGAVARVRVEDGSLARDGDYIVVTSANHVFITTRLFTKGPEQETLDSLRASLMDDSASYETLFARHVSEHKRLFNAMRLDLGASEADRARHNEYLLLDAYNGGLPAALAERMFDYGRYLLISSSRPGGYPAHLQGVWNGDYSPPWNAMYTNNENVQMCYWQALPGNMPDVALCYFDFYESFAANYRENARNVYGCRGFLLPLANSPESAHVMEFSPHTLYWTGAGAWIAQLFYDYFLFTGDETFLLERAIPFMREAALFYEDFMFLDADGLYTFAPSNSPENSPSIEGEDMTAMGSVRPATVNATMDIALAKELFTNIIAACERLGIDEEAVSRWRCILAKMRPYAINEDGALREWLHPDLKDNYHHRHQSHIYPLFPGFEITKESAPELFEACRVAIEQRLVIGLESQTGWSLAHMANVNARLGDGDGAWRCLEALAQSCLGENLFTYHNDWRGQGLCLTLIFGRSAPFQMDANMGWTAAMLEMLLFSKPGEIKLLPALPSAWRRGQAENMLCRGGIKVSISWDRDARTITAELTSKQDQTIELGLPSGVGTIHIRKGVVDIAPSSRGDLFRALRLLKDECVVLDAAWGEDDTKNS